MSLVKFNGSNPTLGGWMDDFFSSSLLPNLEWARTGNNTPSVNIRENADSYELEVAAPGLEKKDFNVSVENGLLTISAQKEEKAESNDNYTRREWAYNSFARTFTLPDSVRDEALAATYSNGVLRLTLPKKEEAKTKPPRTIKIS